MATVARTVVIAPSPTLISKGPKEIFMQRNGSVFIGGPNVDTTSQGWNQQFLPGDGSNFVYITLARNEELYGITGGSTMSLPILEVDR